MSNETVTYGLESILKEIKDSIKDVNQKFDSLQKNLNQKFDKIDERLTKLEVGQAKLTEKVDGMDRRLEKVEGTQKNQVWTSIILLG
jgi:flagellar capping protein FliD